MKKQGIVFNYVGHETTEDLNFITRAEILGKKWDDDDNFEYPISIVNGNTGNNWEGESHCVSISSLEKIIANLKAKGANYIEIMYHSDHVEYEINGLKLHKASPEEIKNYEKKRKKKQATLKLEKIAELKREIVQLEQEVNVLR